MKIAIRRYGWKQWLLTMIIGSLCFSCNKDDDNIETPAKVSRTVLLYMMAENSLASYAGEDLKELEEGLKDLPQDAHFIVYIDDTSNPRVIHYQNNDGQINSETVVQYKENLCSVDPAVLQDVLSLVYRDYPAESYGVILWSHGEGWLPATSKVDTRSIGVDNGRNSYSNSGPQMDIADLADVLNDFPNISFLMFDACFMQSIEVAYELRNSVEYIIASPMEIPGPGAPYHKIIAPMFSPNKVDIEGVTYAYYSYYNDNIIQEGGMRYGAAISAVRCSEVEELANQTSKLIPLYVSAELDNIQIDSVFVYDFRSTPCYYDFEDFIKNMVTDEEYKQWYQQLQRTIPYSYTTSTVYSSFGGNIKMNIEKYSGMSMYIPQSKPFYSKYNTDFRQISWYKAAQWDKTGW